MELVTSEGLKVTLQTMTRRALRSRWFELKPQASPSAALPWVQKHVRLPPGAEHANARCLGAGPGPKRGAAAADLASAPSLSSSPSAAAALDAAGSTYSSVSGSSRPSSRDGSLDLSLDASNGSHYGGHANGGHHHANGNGGHHHANGNGSHAGPRAQQHGHGHHGAAVAPAGPGPGFGGPHGRGPPPPQAGGAHPDGRANGFAGVHAKARSFAGPPMANGKHHPMSNPAAAPYRGQHARQQPAPLAHAHSAADRPPDYGTAAVMDRAESLPVHPPSGHHGGGGGARIPNGHAAAARVPLSDAVTARTAMNGASYPVVDAGPPAGLIACAAGASPPQQLQVESAYSSPLPMKVRKCTGSKHCRCV
jgi:hypothetical protein